MFLKLRNFWKLITFTYQFGNYGLLCVNLLKLRTLFEELWTFTGDFFKIWTSFLKIMDFSIKNQNYIELILKNFDVWMPPI